MSNGRLAFTGNRCLRSVSAFLLTALLVAGPLGTEVQAQGFSWPWGDSWSGGRRPGWSYGERPESWRRQKRSYEPEIGGRSRPGRGGDQAHVAVKPSEPLVAVISLSNQRISVYAGDRLVTQSPVSTGQPGHRTPTGIFSVIQKNRYHHSNIYSGAPMPWMHRITWSGIALHGGVVPGYPASHGCIRLPYSFAPRMWAMSKLGMRVIVSSHDVTPSDIVHTRLPAPVMTGEDATVAEAEKQQGRPVHVGAATQMPASQPVTLTDGEPIVSASVSVAVPKRSPLERARAMRSKAIADAAAAEKAAKVTLLRARQTAAEADAAGRAAREATAAVRTVEARLTAAERAAARSPDSVRTAVQLQETMQQKLEVARAAAEAARAAEMTKSDEAFAAAAAANAAAAAKEESAEAVTESASATSPVSVFISRKEGRIFVRQGFNPLFDDTISIRDPERPLGTHVFTAVAAEDGGATLRWTVVTVPDGGSRSTTAAEALDRIAIPQEIGNEISNRLWAGASLIISDQGISRETGRGTDFVVLTQY